jgi:SAM-dependent methyltransferase
MPRAQEDYGIDAPTVVRNLAAIGAVLLIVGGTTTILLLLDRIQPGPLTRVLSINGLATAIVCLVMAFWMVASSKWLKHRVARALLDARAWRGNEAVLDVGCGRGLIAVNAAKRVPRGMVTGVDIWQERDLGGNSPQAIRANAEAAGVSDRLIVDTGDARALPYTDGSFDVVASMTAIHNIRDRAGRTAAIDEAWRVTRPGGQILIFDIRHARSYAAQLRTAGAVDVRMTGPILLWGPVGWRFSATKPTQAHASAGDPAGVAQARRA